MTRRVNEVGSLERKCLGLRATRLTSPDLGVAVKMRGAQRVGMWERADVSLGYKRKRGTTRGRREGNGWVIAQ